MPGYALNGTHEETARLMSAYVEGELRGLVRWRIGRHLARCPLCRSAFRAFVSTMENIRLLARSVPPEKPELAEAVLERIRAQSEQPEGPVPG